MKNVKGARSGAKAVAPHREAFSHHSKSQNREMRRRRNHYAEHYAARQRKKQHYADHYATKTLHAVARLELYKKTLRDKEIQSRERNKHARLIKTAIERDARICQERKIRRNEIMAKSHGRGLRIRHTTWNMDSFVQCRS